MRINTAIIISFIVLLIGFFTNKSFLWIPLSVLGAGFFDLLTREWVLSDRIGKAKNLSILLKLFFAVVGFYAMIGQIVCLGLIIWWVI